MSKKQIITMIDYFSLILVLSYIFFHNINAVFLGLAIALFSINKKLLSNFFQTFNRTILNKNSIINDEKKDEIQSDIKNKVSLVEIIEESGFIPSSDNKDDNIAA